MYKVAFVPSFKDTTPSSQPCITLPTPIAVWNGLFLLTEESNISPSLK